ncbi:hypothetical protein ZOSMA_166G00080 [Zostera marina]|uniref:Uncharacterized protein n=1 Tax=Zostera marina TaxID=29655 RepID=A0A0K9PVN6_ZOSMR|nr:hypothetical protein ZOSMA_166G00080 [Zostera marina]
MFLSSIGFDIRRMRSFFIFFQNTWSSASDGFLILRRWSSDSIFTKGDDGPPGTPSESINI